MKNIETQLNNLPNEYLPIPFWSWNDRLDPEVLKWQIGEMKRVGLGGYFMHARSGLETNYLSDEWMECIEACINEGNKIGMNSWVYDEEGWPSGFAGGLVTNIDEKYHARWIRIEKYSKETSNKDLSGFLGVYIIKNDYIKRLNLSEEDLLQDNNQELYIVRYFSSPYYIDVMSEKAVRAFIECTHERYYSLYGKEFGKGLKGFFTDEPRLFWNNEGDIPWSDTIPKSFRDRYGYDILEFLPLLFMDLNGYEKIRFDFWKLVNDKFVNSYMKQLYDWCTEHNCILTGHVMMEESIFSQMTGTSGVMPFYEYMHIPGIDWLRRMISSPVVPKQVSSVACQLGKKQVLTESFALCGWNVRFEELKWIAEWQFVNGVNLVCQHLEGYTLRGLRKRDYPPSMFFQQPWWEEYATFNSYMARIGYILSSGEQTVDVLLIHPMQSGWIAFDGNKNEAIKKLDEDFIRASENLSAIHADYHYGDEAIIKKYGSIEGNIFKVGKCKYKVIVLPSMINIKQSTKRLLLELINNGGLVVSVGDLPTLCNGVKNPVLNILIVNIIELGKSKEALFNYFNTNSLCGISISDDNGEISKIHYHQRDIDGSRIYYMVNHDINNTYDAQIRINGQGRLSLIAIENAEKIDLNHSVSNSETICQLKFMPMQSYLLEFVEGEKVEYINIENKIIEVKTSDQWLIEDMDLNSLTLDYCEYKIDDEKWNESVPIIKLMDILLNLKKQCNITQRFHFDINMNLELNREFYLVAEKAEEYEIYVNGEFIKDEICGWWKDTSFIKVNIKNYIKNGKNEVILKRSFYQDTKVYNVLFDQNVYETEKNKLTYNVELESIYLLGDFGVVSKAPYEELQRDAIHTYGPFEIIDKPVKVIKGDLTRQGFCFFAGSVLLSQDINIDKKSNERYVLKLERFNIVLAKIYVNDVFVKDIMWRPYEADLIDYLKEGINKLSIKLIGGNRNLLGPHHHINGEVYNVGPESFTGKWSWVEREMEGQVATEEEMDKNYWKDGYCLVRFGI